MKKVKCYFSLRHCSLLHLSNFLFCFSPFLCGCSMPLCYHLCQCVCVLLLCSRFNHSTLFSICFSRKIRKSREQEIKTKRFLASNCTLFFFSFPCVPYLLYTTSNTTALLCCTFFPPYSSNLSYQGKNASFTCNKAIELRPDHSFPLFLFPFPCSRSITSTYLYKLLRCLPYSSSLSAFQSE